MNRPSQVGDARDDCQARGARDDGPVGGASADGPVGSVPDDGYPPVSLQLGSAGELRAQQDPRVSITLSNYQVDHVVRAALGDGAAPNVAAMVADGRNPSTRQALSARYRELQDNRRLSRSLLAGLLVLSCFSGDGPDLGIKDISDQLDLNTSTVHRYVVTLVAAGLLERDPETRRYRRLA